MSALLRIARYALRDLARSRWLPAYALLLLASAEALLRLSGGRPAGLAALTSLVLLLVPLVSVVFGIMYLQASRDFITLLLAQPVSRRALFGGLYAGLAGALCAAFLAGFGLPLALEPGAQSADGGAALLLVVAGILLTLSFISLAFLVAALVSDRVRAFGAGLVLWLFCAVVFDALLLLAIASFADYPLERPLMIAVLLDPIDLARVLVLLRLDAAALLGYTGAVFQEFFGRALGTICALAALLAWSALPLLWGIRCRERSDF